MKTKQDDEIKNSAKTVAPIEDETPTTSSKEKEIKKGLGSDSGIKKSDSISNEKEEKNAEPIESAGAAWVERRRHGSTDVVRAVILQSTKKCQEGT